MMPQASRCGIHQLIATNAKFTAARLAVLRLLRQVFHSMARTNPKPVLNSMRRYRLGHLSAMTLCCLVAGCGGFSPPTSQTTASPPPTKAQTKPLDARARPQLTPRRKTATPDRPMTAVPDEPEVQTIR